VATNFEEMQNFKTTSETINNGADIFRRRGQIQPPLSSSIRISDSSNIICNYKSTPLSVPSSSKLNSFKSKRKK